MSKHIEMIPLGAVARVAIVKGNGRLAAQVKRDTGCDHVINFGFFEGKAPTHHLKADGTVLAKEDWTCWGYAWDTGPDIQMVSMPAPKSRNYISGLELISPMTREIGLQYDREGQLGGIRGRTAVALKPGALILYCSNDGADASTLEGVRDELAAMGAESAVYGDGGGSAQGAGDGWAVKSGDKRPVYSYLCVWLKNQKEDGPVEKRWKACLDAGHDEGCVNGAPDGSYKEYEFAWDMVGRVGPHLERCGIDVVTTRARRDEAKSLTGRASISNRAGADVFLSMHSNAPGAGSLDKDGWCERAGGLLIFTSVAGEGAGRNKLARCILTRMRSAGVRISSGGLLHKGYTVLTATTAPANIIEFGFHTNREDVALLKDSAYRDKLAEGVARGVCDYLGVGWVAEPVEEPVGPWYAEDMRWVKEMGLSDVTRPEDTATRAELWAMIHNVYKAIKAGK